jgi:hypothetical protein
MDKDRLPKILLNYTEEGHRDTRRPNTRWKDEFSRRRNRPEGLTVEAEKGQKLFTPVTEVRQYGFMWLIVRRYQYLGLRNVEW